MEKINSEGFDKVEIPTPIQTPESVSEGRLIEVESEIVRQQEIIDTTTKQVETLRQELGIDGDEPIPSLEINKSRIDDLKIERKKDIEWLKLNDHAFNKDNFYRVIDAKGYRDFEENKIVRSSPTGTDPYTPPGSRFDLGSRPTSFPSFSKGAPALDYARDGSDNYILESDLLMYKAGDKNPVSGRKIGGRHWAYRAIDETGRTIEQLPPEAISNVYKRDQQGDLYLKKEKDET